MTPFSQYKGWLGEGGIRNALIVGGLTFLPALALGPIVEHLAMLAGQTF